MEITEVRVKLVPPGNDKLRAFCSITIDNNFVIRDLKVIEGAKGAFVAMPSRKLMTRCPRCGGKNHHRASYCNDCGTRLPADLAQRAVGSRAKLHADIAHPINSQCRDLIQRRVLDVYGEEQVRAADPSYRPASYEEDYEGDDFDPTEAAASVASERPERRAGPVNLERPARLPPEPVREGEPVSARSRREPPLGERPPSPARSSGAEAPWHAPAASAGRAVREVHSPPRSGGETEGRSSPARRTRRTSRPDIVGRDRPEESKPPSDAKSRRARRRWDDLDTEPEDNFGAGLFS